MGIYTFFCSDFHSSIWCEMKEGLEWKNQTLTFSVNCVLSMRIDQKKHLLQQCVFPQNALPNPQSWLVDWLGNWLGDGLLWLVFAMNCKLCQFTLQNWSRDAKVMCDQRKRLSTLWMITQALPIAYIVELKMVHRFWAHSSVSSWHMSFWCP